MIISRRRNDTKRPPRKSLRVRSWAQRKGQLRIAPRLARPPSDNDCCAFFFLVLRSISCSFAFRYLLKKGSNPSYYPKKANCIFLFYAYIGKVLVIFLNMFVLIKSNNCAIINLTVSCIAVAFESLHFNSMIWYNIVNGTEIFERRSLFMTLKR